MKFKHITIFMLVVGLALGFSACGPKEAPTVLTFVEPNGLHTLSMDDLKEMPVTEGQAGIKSSTGQITIPEKFEGVALKDLIAAYNIPFDASMGVNLTAQDGYSMTFSYDQVMNGAFTAYDPANGNELKNPDPLTAILAYARDDQPLDTEKDGTIRLVVVSPKNNQVVDGHWSVKWINKVEIKPVGQVWKLDLQGTILSSVDRSSFQSCASPSCHCTEWQDENSQTWEGVPLWLLVGQVDDENTHDTGSYNATLADAGYTVDVIGSDGFTVTLDSVSIKRNGNIIVAYLVNKAELPEQYYPLRLVGSGVVKKQMVGQIVSIVVHVPGVSAATAEPGASPVAPEAGAGGLVITGKVNQPLDLSDADLHAMEAATISAIDSKGNTRNFTGIKLNTLLDLAGIQEGVTRVVFTASDGYSIEIDLANLRACPNNLLAFMDTAGAYQVVLPDEASSTWVKNIVQIEVK